MKKYNYILETPRMKLRQFESSDLDCLFNLNSEPLVMTYINGGIPLTRAEVQRNLDLTIQSYSQSEHLGLWVAEDKETDEFLGWFSLKPLRGTAETEVGYRLMKKYWGNGLATEGAKAMVERGYAVAGLNEISAIVHPENLVSRKVLEKVGFKWVRQAPYYHPIEKIEHLVDWFRHVSGSRSLK